MCVCVGGGIVPNMSTGHPRTLSPLSSCVGEGHGKREGARTVEGKASNHD